MTAEENQPPSGRAASRPPLVRVGAVTDAFFEAVEGAADGLPRGALERLARGGVTIRVAATLTAALPELRRVPVPPAYAALGGGGWDGIAGAYVWSRGRIGIAEYVELLGARFENELALYALRHEVGHALDDLGRISSSPGFALAWGGGHTPCGCARWLRGIPVLHRTARNGKREVFAEAFAIVTGGGASPAENRCIGRYFADPLRYVTSYVKRLRDDEDYR